MRSYQRRQRDAFNARMAEPAKKTCVCGEDIHWHDYEGEAFEGPLVCKKTGCKGFVWVGEVSPAEQVPGQPVFGATK